jgi:hypothetical protein
MMAFLRIEISINAKCNQIMAKWQNILYIYICMYFCFQFYCSNTYIVLTTLIVTTSHMQEKYFPVLSQHRFG